METVWTVLTLSGQFQHCPDWYERVRMVLILSRQFCPDGFKLSGRFSNCPDGFQTVRMVLKLSGRCHIIFKTKREMITQFDMLREIFTHFLYVAREVYAFFWRVAAKWIRALRPESFCAWKAAIRKVLGFCASAPLVHTTNCGMGERGTCLHFMVTHNIPTNSVPVHNPHWATLPLCCLTRKLLR